MLVIDHKYKLAFFDKPRATALTIVASTAFFLVWDLLGIGLNIFYEGESKYTTGIMLAEHLPLEELFFLLFFSYITLLLIRGFKK